MAFGSDISILRGVPQRLSALRPDSPRRWGRMTPVEMLGHVRQPLLMALGEVPMEDKSNILTRTLLRGIVLHGPWPKGKAKAPANFFPASLGDFEGERRLTLEALERFLALAERDPARRALNPLLGHLTMEQWVLLHRRHFNHHLTQFGV